MAAWTVHFDGLYEPRFRPDGVATYGFVVRHGDTVVYEGKGVLAAPGEGGSANVAEYGALIHALTWMRDVDRGGCPLLVYGDSRLVVETVRGTWNLTSERLKPLRDLAVTLATEVRPERIDKIGRDANAEADRLSREAYHAAVAAHPEWGIRKADRARRA